MIWFAIVIVLILFGLGYYFFGFRNPSRGRTVEIFLKDIAIQAEVADTSALRAQGLSHRASLADNSGMYFIFQTPNKSGFWMKDMNFPIDIIWLKGNEVVGISKNALPEPGVPMWRLKIYYPPAEVDRVLEVRSGLSEKIGLLPGDRIEVAE